MTLLLYEDGIAPHLLVKSFWPVKTTLVPHTEDPLHKLKKTSTTNLEGCRVPRKPRVLKAPSVMSDVQPGAKAQLAPPSAASVSDL